MAEGLSDDAVLQRAPGALVRQLLDGLLVFGPEMSQPLRFSTPSEVLWAMLAEPCDLADLVEAWAALYGVSYNTARTDLELVLAAWLDGGALTVTRGSRQN